MPPWRSSRARRTRLFDRSYFPQKFWARRQRCSSVRGTTALRHFYLFGGVDEGVRLHDREDNEKNIGIGVGERTKAVVFFLSGSIPQAEVYHPSVKLDCRRIVIKHGGDVFSGELVLGVTKYVKDCT